MCDVEKNGNEKKIKKITLSGLQFKGQDVFPKLPFVLILLGWQQ
jgi:hypothetical protein